MNSGMLAAILAYTLWGLLPVYWKLIQHIPAAEILAHRIVWSFILLAVILAVRDYGRRMKKSLSHRQTLLAFAGSGTLLAINWLTYIWAVNSGFIVEASLGYYINPLVNVVLGVLFLKERLRPWQWLAVGLALAGVAYLTFNYGRFPWISLTLAGTFGLYGLLRKTATLGSLEGLSVEMALLILPALGYLAYLHADASGAFGETASTTLLLVLTGAATATPLLLFAYGARKVPLSTIGILQYIAPSMQLVLGVVVYGEPFPRARFVGFLCIWIALLIYTTETVLRFRKRGAMVPKAAPVQGDS